MITLLFRVFGGGNHRRHVAALLLADLGVQQTVSAQELVARTLATSLETPHAGEMMAKLVESGQHLLAEVGADGDTVGKALSAVRDERSGLVLGGVHDGRFTLGIDEDPVVAAGDLLLVAEPGRRRRTVTAVLPGAVWAPASA